ncbi:MAG: hypothetical protein GY754_31550 [bacterium]|nr:hypothetical protein [bacterium]
MSGKITNILVIAVTLCYPATVWARDIDGLIHSCFTFLYFLVIGILLLCFIIYSIVKLIIKTKPEKKQGTVVFKISIILIAPTIIIPILLIHSYHWIPGVIGAMSVFFGPILLLSIISAVLAKFVMRRSLSIDE